MYNRGLETGNINCDLQFYIQRDNTESASSFSFMTLNDGKIFNVNMRGSVTNHQHWTMEDDCRTLKCYDYEQSSPRGNSGYCPREFYSGRNPRTLPVLLLRVNFFPNSHSHSQPWRNKYTFRGNVYEADLTCGPGNPGPSGCDNQCGSTAEDLGCGCGEPGPSGCHNLCGSTAEDLGCGCGEPGPSGCDNQCGSTLENLGFGCGVDVGYVGITSGTCASNGYSDIMDVSECKAAAIEVGFAGGNANDPHRQTENDRPHGCRRQTFGPPLWINNKPNSPTRASNVHSVVCKAADFGCGPGNPGPSGCDNQCGSTLEDLGCGCGEPGPSGCDNQCGSTLEDLGFGCGEPGPS